MRKRTHEEFIKLMEEANPNIEVLGTYVNTDTKILCRCKIDGYEWETTPYRLLKKGVGCPKCNNKIRRTHEEFMQELSKKNEHFNYIIIKDKFINNKTPMECECRICGHTWTCNADRLLHQGSGCPKCANKITAQKQTRSHEQFIQEFHEKNPNAHDILILNHYVNSKTKIKCKCKKDGYEWEAKPSFLLKGTGCPKCAGSLKKTHTQFMQEFYEKNTHANDIKILGRYVNYMSKLIVKCKICGNEWEVMAGSLLRNVGCPRCYFNRIAKEQARTHEQFLEFMEENHPDIEVLGEYKNAHFKIKFRCKKDGYEWYTEPQVLLNGSGCPKCIGRHRTTEEFISMLKEIDDSIEVIGNYVKADTKIKCKCKLCGNEWQVTPSNLLQGTGCPKCSMSKGEKRVAQYLDNLDIDYIYNTGYFKDLVSVNGRPLRPDFIIPGLKIWIEYDGIQHYEPQDFTGKMSAEEVQEQFEYTQQNDQIKNQYAKTNNWTLIRIPYWDIDNIEQILNNYLKQEEELAL